MICGPTPVADLFGLVLDCFGDARSPIAWQSVFHTADSGSFLANIRVFHLF